MLQVFCAPQRYVQGRNATQALPKEMARLGLGGPAFLIAGSTPRRLLEPVWQSAFGSLGMAFSVVDFGGECSRAEIARRVGEVRAAAAATVIGVGGGKVLDTARAVAAEVGLPVVCCPTTAASDAPCSALSVVYSPEGVFESCVFYRRNPDLVLVDTSVIAKAPVRTLIAGMGDALATRFEAEASRAAFSPNQVGGLSTLAAAALAELCYRTLLADGRAAVAAVEQGAVTPAVERIIEANTLLSGLGFESGGLALAHAVHNGLTVLAETHQRLHGEKVAFGTLVQLVLEGRSSDCINEVLDFCLDVGLPVTLEDLGLFDHSEPRLNAVALRVLQAGETSHHVAFSLDADQVQQALKAADGLGRARKLKRQGSKD